MDVQERIIRKVGDLAKKPGNSTCAECPERHPTWVSILHPPLKGGEPLAAFVCRGCYKHHFKMGTKICEVKGLSMATAWSEKELEIVLKTGNEMVNSIYEGLQGDFNDEKEIITFDKNEEAKLRGQYIHSKYIQRKYFSEDQYHATMTKLNPDYSTAQGKDSAEPATPKKKHSKGKDPKSKYNTSSPPEKTKEVVDLPQRQHNTRASSDSLVSVLATPVKTVNAESSLRGRRTIPTSGLITPRNNGRRSAADLYGRQNIIMAPGYDLDSGSEQDNDDGDNLSVSQRGRRSRRHHGGLSASMQGARDRSSSVRRRGSVQHSLGGNTPSEDALGYGTDHLSESQRTRSSSSVRRRGSVQHKLPSDDALGYGDDHLSESQRASRSSRRRGSVQHKLNLDDGLGYGDDHLSESQRVSRSSRRRGSVQHKIPSEDDLGYGEDHLSESQRSTRSSSVRRGSIQHNRNQNGPRPGQMDRMQSDRSLGGTQHGSKRRQSLADSNRSQSARSVLHDDRSQRKRSLLHPEESESESEAEREILPGRRKHGSLEENSNHKPEKMMTLPQSLQMIGANGLDRRRVCMLQARQRLSSRSLGEKSSSDRNLNKKKLSKAKSMGDESMEDNSSGSKGSLGSRGSTKSETHSIGTSPRKMRASRSMDAETAKAFGGSRKERSNSGDKRSSSRGKRSKSMKDMSEPDRSTRGKRSSMKDSSEPERSTRGKRSEMKDSSEPEPSTGGRRSVTKDSTEVEHSTRGKRSSMSDDRSSRSKRTTGLAMRFSTGTVRSKSPGETMDFDWANHKAKLEKKNSKKSSSSSKFKRRQSTGAPHVSDSDSEDSTSDDRSKEKKFEKKSSSRRSTSGKKMARSSSTGNMTKLVAKEMDSSEDGKKKTRKVKKSATFHAGKQSTKADKYKNLDNNVKSSTYSAGSLGVLMAVVQANEQGKEKNEKPDKDKGASRLGAAGTLSLMAMGTGSNLSGVFGLKGRGSVAGIRNAAPRESMVSQWLSPEAVAEVATSINTKERGRGTADDIDAVAPEPVWLSI